MSNNNNMKVSFKRSIKSHHGQKRRDFKSVCSVIPDRMLTQIEEACKESGLTRSSFLRRAITNLLNEYEEYKQTEAKKKPIKKKINRD